MSDCMTMDNHIYRDIFVAFVRVHILHHAAHAPVFGLEMIAELRHHGYSLSPGTLYPIFHALEEAGYLTSTSKVVGGKTRKYYRATASGKKILSELKDKIRELFAEVLSIDGLPTTEAHKTRKRRPTKATATS
jgi:DNA-binding PadR family transcriptional regulator